jgi:NitT/TauT family transport system ATP-binding protein
MDEPFSSLDDLTASQLRAEVVSILKNTKTSVKSVIMISHNVDEVAHMSDKIIVMSKPPSKIVDKISIEMKYPRSKGNKTIEGIINRIYSDLY